MGIQLYDMRVTTYLVNIPRADETIERTMLKITAKRNPVTVNPSIRLLARRINKPLIKNDKIPSVKILIGNVRILTIGLIKVLITASTNATRIAVTKLLISTFGNK